MDLLFSEPIIERKREFVNFLCVLKSDTIHINDFKPEPLRIFFFFKQKTAYEIFTDWSSDVCSSDLGGTGRSGHSWRTGRRPAGPSAAGPAGSPGCSPGPCPSGCSWCSGTRSRP